MTEKKVLSQSIDSVAVGAFMLEFSRLKEAGRVLGFFLVEPGLHDLSAAVFDAFQVAPECAVTEYRNTFTTYKDGHHYWTKEVLMGASKFHIYTDEPGVDREVGQVIDLAARHAAQSREIAKLRGPKGKKLKPIAGA